MRSTATVPSAAAADTSPRWRSRPGRTNSPSRAGRARIAMNPTDEIASSGPAGTRTLSGASRLFQRSDRHTWTTKSSATYAPR